MYTLGINAVYHDSAACLVKDGIVLAAAEEERFTGIKHGKRPVPFSAYELPFHAIDFCLRQAGVTLKDVDHVAYSYDPNIFEEQTSLDALFVKFIKEAPNFLLDDVPHHLGARIKKQERNYQWHYVPHHLAHAASAFFPSPFEHAAVMTLDGRGERSTTSYYWGRGNAMELLGEVHMPHSLGILYEKVTSHLGFLHSSDEYKVMALASYGQPKYLSDFRRWVQVNGQGTYVIDQTDFEERLGPARTRGSTFEQKHFDVAQSLQKVIEETVLRLSQWLYDRTKETNLCLAGGVALNCVLNARLRDQSPFRNIWVQPAAGDAGTALGAALWIDTQESKRPATVPRPYTMNHAYLGPEYSDGEIEEFLKWSKSPYRKLSNVAQETAQLLTSNKIIGWFQGRMEFGPRALGGRSILASPIQAQMQQKLNEIKDREDFRPVAPAVLEEDATGWFINARQSPFMLFVYDVRPEKIDGIPAVCHVDGTARIQTVREDQNPLYNTLLKEFKNLTGVPVVINTSFNTRGKPIVCTPRDAVECFWTSPLDALVIGSFCLEKDRA